MTTVCDRVLTRALSGVPDRHTPRVPSVIWVQAQQTWHPPVYVRAQRESVSSSLLSARPGDHALSPLRSRYCESIESISPLDICLYVQYGKHFKRSGSTAFTMSRQQHGDGQLLGAKVEDSKEARPAVRAEVPVAIATFLSGGDPVVVRARRFEMNERTTWTWTTSLWVPNAERQAP